MAYALNSLARVVNAHALNPHCIPQVMLATFKVRKYFWVSCHWSSRSYCQRDFYSVTREPFPICSIGFLCCWFRVTHLTVSCGVVPVSFTWSWLFSQVELLFENYGWHCICLLSCHSAAGLCSHVWVCRCSAHAWLLSLFCLYYFSSQGHETCLNAHLLSNSKSHNKQ